ncbi:MAG: proton-conducting transporter membrane subunit, partial [Armatimonadota bacterium]
MELLIAAAILLPLIGSAAAGVIRPKAAGGLSVLVVLLTAAVALYVGLGTFPGGVTFRVGTLPWMPELGDMGLFGVLLDPLSLVMLLVVVVVGFFVVLYSTEYMSPRNRDHPVEEGNSRYFFWLLLFVGAMTGVALSPNLLQLFIFWELTTICSWALISHYYDQKSLAAGYKALIMTHLGGVAFLVAIIVIYTSTGSVEFDAVSQLTPGGATTVFVLFLVSAWAKASQIPFHTWLPDAMTAPTPISCYLHAAAMVKAGVYLVARVVLANGALPATGAVVGVIAA